METQERILLATFDVVAKHTINGTRMPMIARQAGISQGLIHYHFHTKEKLLIAMCKWLFASLREYRGVSTGHTVLRVHPATPEELRNTFLEYLRILAEEERDMVRVFYDFWVQAAAGKTEISVLFRKQLAGYREHIARTLRTDHLTSSECSALTALFASVFEGAIIQLLIDPEAFDIEQYLRLTDTLTTELSS